MYDVDGNGVIDQEEMTKIVQVRYCYHYHYQARFFLNIRIALLLGTIVLIGMKYEL